MKKTLFPIAAIALTLAACNSTPKFTVNGTIAGEKNGNVLLVQQNGSELDTLAKSAVTDGKFALTGTVNELTDVYLLVEGKRGGFPIFLENTVYTANLDFTKPGESKIEGTENQKLFNDYNAIAMESRKFQQSIMMEYRQAYQAKDVDKMNELKEKSDKKSAEMAAKEEALFAAHSDSFVVAFILSQKASGMEAEELQASFDKLGENAKASKPGKTIAERLAKLAKVAVGQVAPDFTLNTPEGKPLSMHSIKAKVKVIDFWASWCGPCRGENPNVVAMYNELHSKGLEILSVSLDNNKDAWVKAIADDKLTWNHVSDLKGWKSAAAQLYAVNGIPHLVVLDENNVIVAKNLRGAALKAKVAELLAK